MGLVAHHLLLAHLHAHHWLLHHWLLHHWLLHHWLLHHWLLHHRLAHGRGHHLRGLLVLLHLGRRLHKLVATACNYLWLRCNRLRLGLRLGLLLIRFNDDSLRL